MLALRFVIIGLGAVLGIALIARGNVLIGGILCALAVARLAMVATRMHRRRAIVERVRARRQERRIAFGDGIRRIP